MLHVAHSAVTDIIIKRKTPNRKNSYPSKTIMTPKGKYHLFNVCTDNANIKQRVRTGGTNLNDL